MSVHATTRLVALLGQPVAHSRSPAMHNAAFAHLGLDWRYLAIDVAPQYLRDAVRGLRALGFAGANVTVPHKEAVLDHLDVLTPVAERIGAVNTVVVEADGRLRGDNTDAAGFVADLRSHGVEPWMKRALVLGAGGSARACVVGLAEHTRPALITVCNRSAARAEALVRSLRDHVAAPLEIVAWDERAAAATRADLIVNCTSVGMAPRADASPLPPETGLHANQSVYDLVYRPRPTRLLEQADAAGARAIDGLGMLLRQGALAFEAWTGQPAPLEPMRAALENE